jgi:hypothetical protein
MSTTLFQNEVRKGVVCGVAWKTIIPYLEGHPSDSTAQIQHKSSISYLSDSSSNHNNFNAIYMVHFTFYLCLSPFSKEWEHSVRR